MTPVTALLIVLCALAIACMFMCGALWWLWRQLDKPCGDESRRLTVEDLARMQ